jgi:pimeloyl-ACP methyl ester carboxylesterase
VSRTERSGHFAALDGTRISFRELGPSEAQPIVLIAGWPQTLHAWRHIQSELAERGVRSIALDPPGLGDSDVLGQVADYSTSNIARIMAEALASAGVTTFTLVGHDIGAWISFAWGCHRPAGIDRLVLVDAAIPGALPDTIFVIGNAARVFQFFFNSAPELPERLTRGRERIYLEWLFDAKAIVSGAIDSHDVDVYMLCYGQAERMSAGFNYYRAVSQSIEDLEALELIAIPVLAVGADQGVGASLGVALNARCLDLTTVVISDCGHFIPEEAPLELCELIQGSQPQRLGE